MRIKSAIYRLRTTFPSSDFVIAQIKNTAWPLILLLVFTSPVFCDNAPKLLRESEFQDAIDRALIANGGRANLRDYLQRLSAERQVAIWLDRRIDPSQRINIDVSASTFDSGIRKLASQLNLELSVVADSLIIGPRRSTRQLKTRVLLARQQLDEVPNVSPKRQFELLRRYELHWEDITSPKEILDELSKRYKLKIENIEAVPHDLWYHGTLSYPNLAESLTIVLSQFQLSFEWIDANTIRITPEPTISGITEKHRPRSMNITDAMKLVTQSFPQLDLKRTGSQIEFTGLVEEHEAVAILIGEKAPRRTTNNPAESKPLRQRTFTLKMVRKPFGSLMATLEQQGISVRYNAQELNTAGIDLGKKISLELRQATIDQLLKEACDKVGLDYEISDYSITLKVKPMEN